MASFNLSVEQIMNLMDSISPKSKEDIMTTYEVLVAKGEGQGIAKGAKLERIKAIWDAYMFQMSVTNIAAMFKMAPSVVQKWLKRLEWIQQGEAEGLTPAEIALKVNELAAESVVLEWEVSSLLAFFKEQPAPKTKKRRPKKES
jgi:hypothetical protein